MRDVFYLDSLGRRLGRFSKMHGEETLTRQYIYNTPFSTGCQAKKIPLGGGWCVRWGHKTTIRRTIIFIIFTR